MKLYKVYCWCDWDTESGTDIIKVAERKEDAESLITNAGYYNCAEAEEITEIDGYKIILEKIK